MRGPVRDAGTERASHHRMKTIAETFLELNGAGASRAERTRGDPARDTLATCDATRDAYLGQSDLPASDAVLAPPLFDALRTLIAAPPASTPPTVPTTEPPVSVAAGSSPLLLAAAPILAAVLIASITLGTLSLSIVLTVALAMLAWLGGGGRLFGLALPARTASPAARPQPRAVTRMPSLARLETAFRQADALLALAREERQALPAPALDTVLDQGHLQFLQDLAEAGAAQDGDHLVKLVARRLPAVAQGQDLRFATFETAPDCFVIDEAREPARRGTIETLRPAILRGERCMARGYARRYV